MKINNLLKYLAIIPVASSVMSFNSTAVAGPLDYGFITVENERNWAAEDLQFKFSHRFNTASFPHGALSTFNLGYKNNDLFAKLDYVSTSNELEFDLGYHILSESKGHPLSLGAKLGYSLSSLGHNAVGEINVLKSLFYDENIKAERVGLGAFCRGLLQADLDNNGKADGYLAVPGVGLSVTVISGLNLVGEVSFPLINNVPGGYTNALVWGAGLQFWIPDSPHILSLNVSNAGAYTTAGGSMTDGMLKISYEFATAIHLPVKKEGSEPDPFDEGDSEENKEEK